MIHHSETITKLMGALLKVQGQVSSVPKDAMNPHFKRSYASMESVTDVIRAPCQAAGLVVLQAPGESMENTIAVTTMISHAESGEWLKSTIQLPMAKADPQGAGSAITYACRYSLMAMFVLPPVDDDGETASRPAPPPKREAVPDVAAIEAAMLQAIADCPTLARVERVTADPKWAADMSLLLPHRRERVEAAAVAHRDAILRASPNSYAAAKGRG